MKKDDRKNKEPYDLTEEASKRPDEESTTRLREAENRNGNEDPNAETPSGANDDAENRVWTSLSDD